MDYRPKLTVTSGIFGWIQNHKGRDRNLASLWQQDPSEGKKRNGDNFLSFPQKNCSAAAEGRPSMFSTRSLPEFSQVDLQAQSALRAKRRPRHLPTRQGRWKNLHLIDEDLHVSLCSLLGKLFYVPS